MMFPEKIIFTSDGNELELKEIPKIKPSEEPVGVYTYVKSQTKKDQLLTLTKTRIEKLVNDKLVQVC